MMRRRFLTRATNNLQLSVYNISQKYLSTIGHQRNLQEPQQQDLLWQQAKPVTEIPSPPKHWLLGHALLLRKHTTTLHKLHEKLYQEHGNIVRLQNPGSPDIVCTYDPKDSSTMYNNDGRTPEMAFFDPIVFYR